MQSFKKPKNRKPLFIALSLVVLIAVAVGTIIFITNKSNSPLATETPVRPANSVDYGPPTETEEQIAEQQKEDIIKQNEQTPPTTDGSISVSIIRADQAGPGQPLNIRADITGVSTGSCEVTLTKAGQSAVVASFAVIFEATSSRCQGADIPAAQFGENGEWDLTLVIKANQTQSKPVTQKVTIQK